MEAICAAAYRARLIMFYRVSLGFTEFYFVLLGFLTEFSAIIRSYLVFFRSDVDVRGLLRFSFDDLTLLIEFYLVLLGFTWLYWVFHGFEVVFFLTLFF